jgi:hypothetical protein
MDVVSKIVVTVVVMVVAGGGWRYGMRSASLRHLGAEAMARVAGRGLRWVDATAQGDPRIRVGTEVTIAGVNPFFENAYT